MLRLFTRAPQVSDPRTVELQLADGTRIEVSMCRHPRARRIKLSVDERGARLTLPTRASERAALDFLHAHRDWLQAQWRMLHAELPTPLAPGTSTALPLRGASHPLAWQAGRLTRVQPVDGGGYRFDVRGLRLGMATTPAMQRALRDFYEAEARADLARWLPTYTAALPKPPSRIVLKRTSTQWGSLSPTGVMALDLALVLARPSAFEYVLVHELCHLIHHDHSRAFWREVEARCPHWRDERDYLHAEGRRLKAALRMLCG
ncbi:hypothetical protein DCD74_10620 [Lysobacter oculi]|uniref:YgjP-like metallopeptidase domain-containing protein n=1 Tax=Solilutibacter oculi TaxID=2698682 RepID=A0A344J7R3_9GAMM|nr:SprT family zinc-dependent metalloprotease [Lysobacter oculi]AXA85073.1 hypothetical protein DCD74_10620 [Lysobacter oculi]